MQFLYVRVAELVLDEDMRGLLEAAGAEPEQHSQLFVPDQQQEADDCCHCQNS